MTSLALITITPCAAMLISACIMRRGFRTWISLLLACSTVVIAAFELRSGFKQTCEIAESECVGVTAIVYLILALWGMFAIALLFRLVAVHRR